MNYTIYLKLVTVIALATSAAYGVYQFSMLFTPHPISLLTSIAFELVLITLMLEKDTSKNWVAILAVVSSVLYNTLYAVFSEYQHISEFDTVPRIILSIIHASTLSPLLFAFVHHSGKNTSRKSNRKTTKKVSKNSE